MAHVTVRRITTVEEIEFEMLDRPDPFSMKPHNCEPARSLIEAARKLLPASMPMLPTPEVAK